jgi:hypothetical protein
MSNKMKYGPHFKPTITSASYVFDEATDIIDKKHRQKTAAIVKALQNQPQYKKELRQYSAQKTVQKQRADCDAVREVREHAEEQMAETVRKAVAMLEFGMTALVQCPGVRTNYKAAVNQIALINAIVGLKTKCGVSFSTDGDFTHLASINDVCVGAKLTVRTPEEVEIESNFRLMTRAAQDVEKKRQLRIKMMKATKAKIAT